MNSQTNPRPTAKTYSPFWALLALFLTLIVLQISYVIGDFKQQSQIQAARAQLTSPLTQARNINQTTEAVGRELIALSTNSAEAAKIIAEFKIQINQPAQAPK